MKANNDLITTKKNGGNMKKIIFFFKYLEDIKIHLKFDIT